MGIGQRHQQLFGDIEVDGLAEPDGFGQAILWRMERGLGLLSLGGVVGLETAASRRDGNDDERARRCFRGLVPLSGPRLRKVFRFDTLVYGSAQLVGPSDGSASIRCTGAPGMMVDIACL